MLRFNVVPVKLTDAPVETFTIDVNDIQDDSATINLSWARVRVPIKLQLDIVNELLARDSRLPWILPSAKKAGHLPAGGDLLLRPLPRT